MSELEEYKIDLLERIKKVKEIYREHPENTILYLQDIDPFGQILGVIKRGNIEPFIARSVKSYEDELKMFEEFEEKYQWLRN